VAFTPNRKFRRKYNWLFKKNPEGANLFLLICEITDGNGRVQTSEEELAELMTVRFKDPQEYAL